MVWKHSPGATINIHHSEVFTDYYSQRVMEVHEIFYTTKDVLPRSAYFDDRPRNGHTNATVILIQVRKIILNESRIIGCGVDSQSTNKFEVCLLDIYETFVHWEFSWLTHDEAMVTCYDLTVHNNSKAFVTYYDDSFRIHKVHSERPLVTNSHPASKVVSEIPSVSSTGSNHSSSLVVCTIVFNEPPWLDSWLIYQKLIGVDFIHIYAQQSFIDLGGLKNPLLLQYIQEGFVKVDLWRAFLDESETYYYSQPLLYVDCIYRYMGIFDYAFLYDTDDFFNPMLPTTDIHFYIEELFCNDSIGSISFQWLHYFPDCGFTQHLNEIEDGNLTKYLVSYDNVNYNFKGVHLLTAVTEVHIHEVVAESMLPGYMKLIPPLDVAYVSHIRKGNNKKSPPCRVRRRRRRRLRQQNDETVMVIIVVMVLIISFFCCCGVFLSIAGILDDTKDEQLCDNYLEV